MTAKANWFLDLDIPAEDLEEPPTRVADVGTEFALDPEKLTARHVELVREEQDLYNLGVRCALKQEIADDACCHACPMRRSNPDDPMHRLCTIGMEQEKALTALAVLRWNAAAPDR